MRTVNVAPKWLLGIALVACVVWTIEWPPYPPVLGFLGRSEANGILVLDVTPGGGAEVAGVRAGDVVHTVNARKVWTGRQVRDALRDKTPGERVSIEFVRGGQLHRAEVQLQARP